MPLGKRTRSYSKRKSVPYARRAKRARKLGRTGLAGIMRASVRPSVTQRVNQLYRMIETKEACSATSANVSLAHNNVTTALSLFANFGYGTDDPMGTGASRIGDQISVRGVLVKGFIENALARARVHYRIMVVRGAKGETFSRANMFKGIVGNKMIDQMNTERFTILAQTMFTIDASNVAASGAEATNGAPLIATAGGQGTKTFKMWVPGYKFGPNGTVRFENGTTQPKFYDYRIIIMAYDWYGTPQDVNNVGKINEMYQKTYFKDA